MYTYVEVWRLALSGVQGQSYGAFSKPALLKTKYYF